VPTVVPRHFKLRSAAALRELKEHCADQAREADEAAVAAHSSFERKLGAALARQGLPIAELLRGWDDDGSGVKKVIFRKQVRSTLGLKADNATIDAYFDRLDSDGGGILEQGELRRAFSQLNSAAGEAQAEADRQRALAEALRARGKHTREAADATEAFEQSNAKLMTVVRARETVIAQCGELIVHKWGRDVTSKELSELLAKWDVRGKREVNKMEFRKGMLGLRVVEPPSGGETIGSLFESLCDGYTWSARDAAHGAVQVQLQAHESQQQQQHDPQQHEPPQQQTGEQSPPLPVALTVLDQPAAAASPDATEDLLRAVPTTVLREFLMRAIEESIRSADRQTSLDAATVALRRAAQQQQHELQVLEETAERTEEARRVLAERDAAAKAEATARVNALRAKARRAKLDKARDERAAFEDKLVRKRKMAAEKRLAMIGLSLEGSNAHHYQSARC